MATMLKVDHYYINTDQITHITFEEGRDPARLQATIYMGNWTPSERLGTPVPDNQLTLHVEGTAAEKLLLWLDHVCDTTMNV